MKKKSPLCSQKHKIKNYIRVKKQQNFLSREIPLVWLVRWGWLGNHEGNALLNRRSDSNTPALLIIFSLVTTRAGLDTCAVQNQSFGDQLSDLREAFSEIIRALVEEEKTENEWVWWFRLHKNPKTDSWGTFQRERQKIKWYLLVWAERNRQNSLSKISECRNLISYLLLFQKISNEKTPNHYNICVNKHIKYSGSVKRRCPRKKASSILFYFSKDRNTASILIND